MSKEVESFVSVGQIARVIINDIAWTVGANREPPTRESTRDYFEFRRLAAEGRGAEARALLMRRHR